ncbi:ATP-binding protein [Actinoplanes sp. NPDC051494]|uniref:ATP-binding protein n=1 Tax=Actinoplanes sp. NPDC051494 TaxID=3363907 RepID=UPI0037BC8F0C
MANSEVTGQSTGIVDLAFVGGDLYSLRSTVAAHVTGAADDRTAESVVLVVHELCSNAVRHGGGGGRLRIWLAGGALYCEVSDSGPGLAEPDRAGRTLPAPSLPGGRGLWIARQMSDLTITTGDTGTTITAVVAL